MISRLVGCVLLLVAASAAADDKKYTLAELEQLAARSAWLDVMHHLADVPRAQRTAGWMSLATKTAVVLGSDNSQAMGLPRVLQMEDELPELLASPQYVKARAPVMYALLDECMHPHAVGACMNIAELVVRAVPKDQAFALKVAKLGRRNVMPEDSLRLFVLALGPKDRATACKDEDLAAAVIAGLGLGADDDRYPQASSIAFTTCWTALSRPILDALDASEATSDLRTNVCKRLGAKPRLVKERPAVCDER